MKTEKYTAGLYMRLSQEDERQGESLSIENQRTIVRKYAEEHGFEIHDEYIDDGISGTTFNRPEVQRLLDDAKTGVINTIIVKDLSRFGRNYIEVGQYLDYIFPTFGIRFIAIQDNVDTENKNGNTDIMLPIMNVFNEFHAANTSKKIRAVKKANAQQGIFSGKKASYGYIMGTDKKRTFIIDDEVAPIVRRIFEMYASGISPKRISEILNAEGILSPGRYAYEKLGHKGKADEHHLWCQPTITQMLNNPAYIGHLAQMRETSVSYKNHKRYKKDASDWVIVYNTHEPIISQELWDKVRARQKHMAQGRKTKTGYMPILSGFVVCADCGAKLKMSGTWNKAHSKYMYAFNCGDHMRLGSAVCFSHFITEEMLNEIVLTDIREMAQRVVLDEKTVREGFLKHNAEIADNEIKTAKRELKAKQKRYEELSRLMEIAYEDRMKGKMPEELCISFLEKYSAEQKTLTTEIAELEQKVNQTEVAQQTVDDFIFNVKKYLNAPELTREMCYELIERVTVSGVPRITKHERVIEIVYKADIASVLQHKLKK